VSYQLNEEQLIAQVPSTIQGEPQRWPVGLLANAQVQDDVIDSIIDRPNLKPSPREPDDISPAPIRRPDGPLWTPTGLVATSAVSSILVLLGLQYGLPLLLQVIRNARKSRGNTLLSDEQFQQLMDQYQQLLKLMEQNAKPPNNIKT